MSPPPTSNPIPPLSVVTEPQFELPEPYSQFPLAICFTYGNVYAPMLLNSLHPLLPALCPKSALYVCLSITALQIGSSVPCF